MSCSLLFFMPIIDRHPALRPDEVDSGAGEYAILGISYLNDKFPSGDADVPLLSAPPAGYEFVESDDEIFLPEGPPPSKDESSNCLILHLKPAHRSHAAASINTAILSPASWFSHWKRDAIITISSYSTSYGATPANPWFSSSCSYVSATWCPILPAPTFTISGTFPSCASRFLSTQPICVRYPRSPFVHSSYNLPSAPCQSIRITLYASIKSISPS